MSRTIAHHIYDGATRSTGCPDQVSTLNYAPLKSVWRATRLITNFRLSTIAREPKIVFEGGDEFKRSL